MPAVDEKLVEQATTACTLIRDWSNTMARALIGLLLTGTMLGPFWSVATSPTHVGGTIPTKPAPVTAADRMQIAQIVRAFFAAMVAHHPRAAYDMLAPCSIVIKLQPPPGLMGLPGRGPYYPGAFARIRTATITSVRVTQDAVLRRYGLMEALVEGTFRIRRTWPYSEPWGDGRHVIGVVFTHCGGRWRLYDPFGHYYSVR